MRLWGGVTGYEIAGSRQEAVGSPAISFVLLTAPAVVEIDACRPAIYVRCAAAVR
jgi:hypothetical protein